MNDTTSATKTPTSGETPSDAALKRVRSALESADAALAEVRTTLDEATGDARSAGRSLAKHAGSLLERAKSSLAEAKGSLADVAEKSRRQIEAAYAESSELYDELMERVRDLRDATRRRIAHLELGRRRDGVLEFVHEKPGTSVMIALGVGLVIGLIVRPRS